VRVRRRGLGSGLLAASLAGTAWAQQPPAPGERFDPGAVRALARARAAGAYREPDRGLPEGLRDLDYDRYRALRFDPRSALWREQGLPFHVQLFHRGFLYPERVDLFEVVDGVVQPIAYDPGRFDFGTIKRPEAGADLGYAGFRLHAALNRPEYFDEVAVFLGASYFRGVGKDTLYGLSARGLAIDVAERKGEEFPRFVSFWIERPRVGASSVVVHALLDSPSCAGAYRFTIRPGETTVMDVEAALYPRVEMGSVGLAPMTSMYLFAANDRQGADDYRPAVHDSDGLLMLTGGSEQVWRPLSNPRDLQVSVFGANDPRGFGLVQRAREFGAYQDLEARYEKRPSLWVEPIGDWGEGSVVLVEIPTATEIHDNIVSFWRPARPLAAGAERILTYRLHWGAGVPLPETLARVEATRIGAAEVAGARRFVLDVAGAPLAALAEGQAPELELWSGGGELRNPTLTRHPTPGRWRIAFELHPGDQGLIELRARMKLGDRALSETWLYRWTT